MTVTNCGTYGHEDYAELGSKFKASHVKTILWFVAFKLCSLDVGPAAWTQP